MKKDYIEENLKNAVEKITPDVYQSIAEKCSFQRNEQNIAPLAKKHRVYRPAWHRVLPTVAAALLVLMVGGTQWNSHFRKAATVSLDVNPSVALELNAKNKVLHAEAQNEDGEAILGDMDLKGVEATVAINALVGSMVKGGYLNENENSVLVSVAGKPGQKKIELREQLLHSVRQGFSENLFSGAVIGQNFSGEDEEIEALAREYQVSAGKAALARSLAAQSVNLQAEDIMKLSVNDMNLLLSSGSYPLPDICVQGTVSSNAYIGNDKALELALENSGFSADQLSYIDVAMSYSGGHVSYEVEFYHQRNKYEYDFDAMTGELLEWEKEWKNEELFAIEMEELERSKSVEGIGEEKALEAAYLHSGVNPEDVIYAEAVPTYEEGMEFYDVDFRTEEYEYEYHIDAASGEVIEYNHNMKIY